MDATETKPTNYKIVGTKEDSQLSPIGTGVVRGTSIQFQDLVTGDFATVFLPDGAVTPGGAQQLIANKLATIRAIHELTN